MVTVGRGASVARAGASTQPLPFTAWFIFSLSPGTPQNDNKWSKTFMRLIKVTEPLTNEQAALKNKTQDALAAVSGRERGKRKRKERRPRLAPTLGPAHLRSPLARSPSPPRQIAAWKEDARKAIQDRIDEKQANEAKNEAAVRGVVVECGGTRGAGGSGAHSNRQRACACTCMLCHFYLSLPSSLSLPLPFSSLLPSLPSLPPLSG